MDWLVLFVFVVVYLGMMLGELPGLALDRTGVALLGAIVLIATERITLVEAWQAIDVPTLGLLFGLMVISAQFRLGGFYTRFTRWLTETDASPERLLGYVIVGAALLSALLANDIVCLAMAPILIESCANRKLRPLPFLLGLACAANVGSAATLIGNPQNMLIGQTLQLSFGVYSLQAAVPTIVGLLLVWWIIVRQVAGNWHGVTEVPPVETPPYRNWQTIKGIVILGLVMAAFLFGSWPREVVALAAAGVILTSRQIASHRYLALVDWNLLILFAGLFIVNRGLADTGLLEEAVASIREFQVDPAQPVWLFSLSVVLSNLVSNVPAVMLLLPLATHSLAGPILAISSTLAGNLLIVGSIANMIVVDQARRLNVAISWRDHFRVGLPVTVATLAVAALWLAFLGWVSSA